jgi:hypothetical protein
MKFHRRPAILGFICLRHQAPNRPLPHLIACKGFLFAASHHVSFLIKCWNYQAASDLIFGLAGFVL